MRRYAIGVLAATGALGVAVLPAAAQTRPDTDFSQSSSSSGPTCIVGGVASDCGGGEASAFPIAVGSTPVIFTPAPVVSLPVGGVFGGAEVGTVSESVDVDQSSRGGTAAAR